MRRQGTTSMGLWKQAVMGLFAVVGLSTSAIAQTTAPIVYDVELIVFQNLQPPGTPEDWVLEHEIALKERPVVVAEDEGPIAAGPETGLDTGLERKPLAREQFRMTALAAQLQRSRCIIADSATLARYGPNIDSTPDHPANADCLDYLFFVHDRHNGNKLAATQYLQWEQNLVSQLDHQERSSFKICLAG